MQPRFAALLFALGLCDLVLVNLGLGPEVFANGDEPSPAPDHAAPQRPEPPPAAPPVELARVTPPAAPQVEANVDPDPPGLPPAASDEAPPSPNEPAKGPAPGAARATVPGAAAPSSLEAASEPAARDAVEAGRALDAELTALTSDLTVAFPDTASAQLTRAAREELLTLAARLREHPNYRLRVVGHADERGSREFNEYLGRRRARAVSELLTAAGVAPEQLELVSHGEDDPREVGTSEGVWAANRRVEIVVASERSETP